jgi:hypothetical protein
MVMAGDGGGGLIFDGMDSRPNAHAKGRGTSGDAPGDANPVPQFMDGLQVIPGEDFAQ